MRDQERAPLLEALREHRRISRIPFHVPAHLGRPLPGFEGLRAEGLFSLDVTELPGLDDLNCPTGPLAEAQALASELFGAKNTFFLVNGVTAGVLAAHLYYGGKGKKILLPRDSHRSHYSGLILAGSTPVYLPAAWQEGVAANVEAQAVKAAVEEYPDAAALFVTSPGYHGACADLMSIREITAKKRIPLVVDEAHGTYLSLSPLLPGGAGEAGADLWLHSTHKSGGALTQGGMLHGGKKTDADLLKLYLGILQTSSPSYPIMASLDEARRVLALEGRERAEKAVLGAAALRSELASSNFYRVVDFSGFVQDPLKLALSFEESGMPGPKALDRLRSSGIEPELAGFQHLLFLISLFHRQDELQELALALTGLQEEKVEPRVKKAVPGLPPPFPRQALLPGQALSRASTRVPLSRARGRVAAEMVVPAPPGIPFLVPGEEVSPEILDLLKEFRESGLTCQMADPTLNTLKVVAE